MRHTTVACAVGMQVGATAVAAAAAASWRSARLRPACSACYTQNYNCFCLPAWHGPRPVGFLGLVSVLVRLGGCKRAAIAHAAALSQSQSLQQQLLALLLCCRQVQPATMQLPPIPLCANVVCHPVKPTFWVLHVRFFSALTTATAAAAAAALPTARLVCN